MRLSWILPLALAAAVFADTMVTVVEPETPLTKRVMLLIDLSGSMATQNRVSRALAAIEDITKQPIDDMHLAVIAFSDSTRRWPGIPEEGIPKDWAALPSEIAPKKAQEWIEENNCGGGTIYENPFRLALEEPTKDLSIILISDGITEVQGEPANVFNTVRAKQAWRTQQGLGRAVIYGLMLDDCYWMKDLVKENGGGLFQLKQDVLPPLPHELAPH